MCSRPVTSASPCIEPGTSERSASESGVCVKRRAAGSPALSSVSANTPIDASARSKR